jgi:hypothetical protein
MSHWAIKILLASIATGLWANIIVPLIRPAPAVAQYETDQILKSIDIHLRNIDVNIDKLQAGSCANGKLCR